MRLWRNRAHAGFMPVFVAGMLAVFRSSILRMLIVLAVPIAALMWFGQPALLFQYWWHGPASYPVYEKCLYVALDGWHVVFPSGYRGAEDCPTVRLVPADIRKLILG